MGSEGYGPVFTKMGLCFDEMGLRLVKVACLYEIFICSTLKTLAKDVSFFTAE